MAGDASCFLKSKVNEPQGFAATAQVLSKRTNTAANVLRLSAYVKGGECGKEWGPISGCGLDRKDKELLGQYA